MNVKMILNTLGRVSVAEAIFMLIPIAVSLIYSEASWFGFAVTAVVPEPPKGSKTKSFLSELAKISFAMSFSGFCVGCAVFSLIDQNGTVISSQKFDGQVSLVLPFSPSFQSLGLPFSL